MAGEQKILIDDVEDIQVFISEDGITLVDGSQTTSFLLQQSESQQSLIQLVEVENLMPAIAEVLVEAGAGADGSTILHGSGPPAGAVGVNNDFYIDIAATDMYGPKTAGLWGSPTSLIGEPNHSLLTNRSDPDAHPMDAITGLVDRSLNGGIY